MWDFYYDEGCMTLHKLGHEYESKLQYWKISPYFDEKFDNQRIVSDDIIDLCKLISGLRNIMRSIIIIQRKFKLYYYNPPNGKGYLKSCREFINKCKMHKEIN